MLSWLRGRYTRISLHLVEALLRLQNRPVHGIGDFLPVARIW